MENQSFFDLPPREQALVAAWANSCPIPEELTDPANPSPGRGPEAMLNRYGQVNFWFGYIHRAAGEVNPGLEEQLLTPVTRLPGERPGKYEWDSVPASHHAEMPPMGTLAGYALPRLFLEQLGTGQNLAREEVRDRLINGLAVLDEAIAGAGNPLEFLALLAEGLAVKAQTTPDQAFKHIFSQGWMDEHNAYTMLAQFKSTMAQKAPRLWARYNAMSEADKARRNLA